MASQSGGEPPWKPSSDYISGVRGKLVKHDVLSKWYFLCLTKVSLLFLADSEVKLFDDRTITSIFRFFFIFLCIILAIGVLGF